MKPKASVGLDAILAVLLLAAVMATILLEIVLSGPTATKLETSLFSILEFIFSLAFTWVIARMSLRAEFQQSQKNFAISAYRRIIEIRNGADRLIAHATAEIEEPSDSARRELDIVNEIGIGIRESIRSSISDWADIIGDEIETVEKIQQIRERQAQEHLGEEAPIDAANNLQERSEADIQKLLANLPQSLRSVDSIAEDRNRLKKARTIFKREKSQKGYFELSGFSEKGTVDSDISNYKEGDVLRVRVGDDRRSRVAALIAYDDAGQSVGIIYNVFSPISLSYDDGAHMLFSCLNRSEFSIELLKIEQESRGDKRHDFSAKILELPKRRAPDSK